MDVIKMEANIEVQGRVDHVNEFVHVWRRPFRGPSRKMRVSARVARALGDSVSQHSSRLPMSLLRTSYFKRGFQRYSEALHRSMFLPPQ